MAEKNVPAKKGGIVKFFKETKAELKKVSWPTKKQLLHNTLIILVFIIITAVILACFDLGSNRLINLLRGLQQ